MNRLVLCYEDSFRPLVPECRALLPWQERVHYPVIPVLLQHGKASKRRLRLVVDSGSDYCYLRGEVGDLLIGKGKWQVGRPTHFVREGLSDQRIPVFFHQMSITLIDTGLVQRRTVSVPVGFCQTTFEAFDGTRRSLPSFAHGHGGLLGQVGFFSEFREVILSYSAKTITLVW
jgi:hypothetical protein